MAVNGKDKNKQEAALQDKNGGQVTVNGLQTTNYFTPFRYYIGLGPLVDWFGLICENSFGMTILRDIL